MFKKLFFFLIALLCFAFPCHAMNQLISSGSVTQANMRISAVNGTSFIDFSAAGALTNYNGCLLIVRDSTGKEIQGWIGADGSGETLGADVLSGWDLTDGWSTSSLASIIDNDSFSTTGVAGVYKNNTFSQGVLYKRTFERNTTASACIFMTRSIDFLNPNDSGISSGSDYIVGEAIYNHVYVRNAGGGTTDVTSMKAEPVTAPASTGVTIFSEKACTNQNFTAKNSSFNYNDSSGYTYQIFRTPAVEVASGTVTAANTQLSLVDGTAFAYFSGVDLSAYQTGKHLLCVYNSSTNLLIAMGYCSATAPAGETLDVEKLSNPSFDADTTGWDIYDSTCTLASIAGGQSNNCLEMTRVSGAYQVMSQGNIPLTSNALYKVTFYVKSGTSGNEGYIAYFKDNAGAAKVTFTGTSSGSWVPRSGYGVMNYATPTKCSFQFWKNTTTAGTMLFDEVSVKQVLDPASTGVRIVNAKGGATQNWLYKGSGAVNEAINYKIYFVGN